MKVKELRNRLERILSDLEGYDDDREVRMVTNTYFLGDCRTFIGISGYDGGYINCNDMVEEEDEYDEEE